MKTHSFARTSAPCLCVGAADSDDSAARIMREANTHELQQAQRLMQVGSIAASIAHDMNNLLAVIEGSVSLATESLPPDHMAQHDLAAISQASRRSSAMIRQLLGFIRQQPPLPFPIHLGDALAGISLLIERIAGRNVTLVYDIAPDLWLITAVHSQIEQVLINLLTNARDAMPEGGQLTLSARNHLDGSGGAFVLLEVADTGAGLSAEARQRMFSPFYTTKVDGKGTGLGMTICAAIVGQLGGRIEVESAPGHGTTVRVLLPRMAI